MKKLSFLSVVLVASAFLFACNHGEEGASQDVVNEGDNGTVQDVVELQWYMIGTPQPDTDAVMEELSNYTEEQIGVRVDMTQIDWGDYEERMQIITSSGEDYDIAFVFGGMYTLNAQRGAYLGLNDLLDSHGQELMEELHPDLIAGASIDGELYGIPANKEIGNQTVLVFNGNLVDEYDFDIESVEDFADLDPMLETIKENEPSFSPISAASMFRPIMPFDYVLGWDMPIAFPLEGDTETVINLLETDEAMEVFEVMRDYYQKGYVPSDAASSTDPWPYSVENWFVRLEGYNPYAELLWEREAGYPIKVQEVTNPIINNEAVTGSLMAISATSQHPEEAMKFLNLLNTDPYVRNLVNYGIEDEHYEKLDDGKIRDLPARSERYSVPQYALGNHFILDLFENDPDDKWEAFEEFNESGVRAPSLGFHFDPTPVRTEIANISNVASEFMPPIFTGSVDPEQYVPMAVERLNEAGMQEVLEEVQNQYDEWKEVVEE
ncbi:ABC transporter substrate-binding protein [Halalkalibacter sp. APA_J-10(15)]|uniref:ABC transporter substrate-binding protein n=1 Tax=Halalkalibacter sp. APA_J-10(15) TaxID=2933805 RepID=UPI001FF3E6FD|nr:ABC transporter substrate-binding protein [Halalkalibacter sp. APA_J-10(15)]MCK0470155.1 ABC transporter substrate-binding protein [Halalkalibacter sp. APA_J-10(15)]